MDRQKICKLIQISTDFIFIFLSFPISLLILYWGADNVYEYLPKEQFDQTFLIHFFLSIAGVIWFWIRLRHYTYRKPFWAELKEILRAIIVLATLELSIMAFAKFYASRYLWLLTWIICLIIMPLGRVLIKKFLFRIGWYLKNTIIIGGRRNAIDAYNALVSEPYLGLKVKYFISLNKSEELKELNIPSIDEKKQSIWELIIKKSDQFIIALEENETEARDFWLRYLSKKHYRSVSVIPTVRGLPLYSTDMSFLFSYDVILLRMNNNLAKRTSRFLKRTMDIVLSFGLILILSPIFLILYLLIYIDGGKPIYKHPRIGRDGKLFNCFKFRSMVLDSEEILSELLKQDPECKSEWEKEFKLKNDPRVTKIGSFIRRTSLDELPQLFNVLIGQMSLVGPRPITEKELEFYENNVDYYLMAKPGITGLWQVSGRNDIDYETRVYFDSWYVKNWSLWNDIAILFKTIKVVFKRSGAY